MDNANYNDSLNLPSDDCNNDPSCMKASNVSEDVVYASGCDIDLDNGKICHDSISKKNNLISELEILKKEYSDKHSRLLADFDNYKKRVSKEIQLAVVLAEKKVLIEFLSVIDNFERCLVAKYKNVEDLNSGVTLIYKQLLEVLRKVGVESVEINLGDSFDAQYSEALTTVNRPDLPDGCVSEIFERGFKFRDHLLRPARVIVNNLNSCNDNKCDK